MPTSLLWPELPYASWRDTCATLHRWLQVAGKVKLALHPHLNHCWEATFYVTPRGLTSGAIPLPDKTGVFALEFDFVASETRVTTSQGARAAVELRPCTVAQFEREFLAAIAKVGVAVQIWPVPVEIPDPVRFELDEEHRSYDAEAVRRWWRILTLIEPILLEFRGRFQGKCSPVHLFWGSLDIAVTRFSGRTAPPRPKDPAFMQDAYSHEVASVGWWAGNDDYPEPAFYAYAVPEPEGFKAAAIGPRAAFYDAKLGEYLLRYEDVRRNPDPRAAVLEFCQSTYVAAAELGKWDRAALERPTR